jgi:hypothetical protein
MNDALGLIDAFFGAVTRDPRLHALHVSLYMALVYHWGLAHYEQPFCINRRQVMQLSGIAGIATYHKGIRELQAWGYIRYEPSYHPVLGSSVCLLFQKLNRDI